MMSGKVEGCLRRLSAAETGLDPPIISIHPVPPDPTHPQVSLMTPLISLCLFGVVGRHTDHGSPLCGLPKSQILAVR